MLASAPSILLCEGFAERATAPVVSFVAPNAAMTAGLSVTVSGLSFSSRDATASVAIGLTSCDTTAWASATSVLCLVAAGSGPSILTSVTVHSVPGTRLGSFSFDGVFQRAGQRAACREGFDHEKRSLCL